jgi:hypothetical protein
MTLDTYGHVMAELSDDERRPAEVEIRLARGEVVPPVPSSDRRVRVRNDEAPPLRGFRQSRRPDSNRGPLHYE